MTEGVEFHDGPKFDLQLAQSHPRVKALAELLMLGKIERIEVKTETYQWRRTGNICIEYECNGRPSGIAVTTADVWVHTLCDDDGSVLMHLFFEVPKLRELCRAAWDSRCEAAGDGDRSKVILLRLADLVRRAYPES